VWLIEGLGQARKSGRAASAPQQRDWSAFLVSLVVHLGILISLGLVPVALEERTEAVVVSATPPAEQTELEVPDEFRFSSRPTEEIGANSVLGDLMAISMAPVVAETTIIPSRPETVTDVEHPQIQLNEIFDLPTGLRYNENLAVKGLAGEGTTGAIGAIDRITHEILLSLEERKTLVVWLFDQTASLIPQRKAIRDRFERIYKELGIIEATSNEAFVKHDDKPLLSAVVAFGEGVHFITKKPTDDLAELKKAVMDVPNDSSGVENTFTAIHEAAKRFGEYRYTTSERSEPERNVMIVVFSDEAGEDQEKKAEEAIRLCRRLAMPVYVIGVPAPFGRKETRMKWVDPDPNYDQTPTWGRVEQGPESLLPEQIKLGFSGIYDDEEPIDSGFGPYLLTRMCVETGGIYFAVHPNRDVGRPVGRNETAPYSAYLRNFFDSEVMRRYRPEYVSVGEYQKRLNQNKARWVLVQAANASQVNQMRDPRLEFVKTEEAAFANALSAAQQAAAALEPRINNLYELLRQGEAEREKETVPRWQAGYDLAMGRVLAVKVRTETYNAMLAAAKRGLKFTNERNNTWLLKPSNEISAGSQYVKLAERAKMYLTRVVKEHPKTPWAMLAERELKDPMGWAWDEKFTDISPPRPNVAANVNVNATPRNDQKKMLPPAKKLRPPPKL
jgi:hypothetical protein